MDKTKCYNRGKEEALRSDSGGLFCGDFLEREKREGNWQGKRVLEVLGCSRQTALLRRAASAAPDGGSPCLGRRESIQSLGPRKIGDFAGKGKRERVIWRGERVLEVLGCSRQTALLRRAASAACDGGSPCLGRRESIQSLGPPQNRRFCGEREKREGNWQGKFLRFFRKSGAFAEKISYNSPGTERSTFCWEMTEPKAREESLLRALSDREVRMMGALPPTTRPAEVQPANTRADLYRALPIS